MRKFVFIFILGLIDCSDNMKNVHTIMFSEKKSIEIKE